MSKLYGLLYTMIGKLNSSVKTTAQTLTDAEKTQARANIGAQPAGDYAEKKDIPTVPTKVSAFTNDAGYLTQHQDLSAYAKKTEIPSKLPNPHALTINGKTYDGSSAVSVKVEGGSGGAQADWKAARNLPGHVLNRTHWVDESGTVLLDDDAVGFADGSALIDDVQLVAGASYIITYNGETEECVAVDDGLGSIMLRPNNLPVDFNYEAPNDEMGVSEAFRIYPHDFEESEAAIKIVLNSEIIHPLDKKFLPDNIGGADWNAAEGEPGHVLNRTHWVEGGMVEVLAEMQMPTEGAATDPDIDLDHSIGLKAGETYTVVHNGNEYKCVAQDMSAMMEGTVAMGDLSAMGLASTGEPFLIIDMAPMSSANIMTAEYGDTLSIYQDKTTIHKLDPKFLPDALQFGDEEVYILPETEVAFVADADMDGMAVATFTITDIPAEGTTCIVTFAGVEYESTVMNMGDNQLYIGNNAMLDGTDTGEPYAIIMATDATGAVEPAMAISLIGETTASVSIKGTRTVPIASGYAPKPVYIDLYALGLTASTDSLVSINLDDGTKASIKAQLNTAAKSGIVRVNLSYALTHANFFFPDSDATERAGGIGVLNMLISGSLGHYKMHCVVLDNIICVEYNSGELRAIARRVTLT